MGVRDQSGDRGPRRLSGIYKNLFSFNFQSFHLNGGNVRQVEAHKLEVRTDKN